MDETVRSIRAALLDAIAGEHRLRRQAVEQRREAERWEQRASMAEMRELLDLAAEARERAERHQRRAALEDSRAAELRVQVERLRGALAASQGHGRAPPLAAPSVEGRFVALELDRELEHMRQARRGSATSDQTGPESPETQSEGG
jgi:hypothetical protein